MKISYNVECLPERRPTYGKPSEETLAVIAFLATAKKNMCFEYEDEAEAKRKYAALRRYRSNKNLKAVFDMYRVDKVIVVLNTKKAAGKGAR